LTPQPAILQCMRILNAVRLCALALCGISFSVSALAQSASAPIATSASNSSSVWGGAWLGLVTLSLLVVLVAVVVWLFRRGAQSTAVGGQIQLLAAFPVGPRERLLVVRMQDRILALGHTPTHISLLAELDDFEPQPGNGSLPSGFAGQLMTLLSGKNGP
jgi:flagellar protein FliO/FliZ